MAKKRTKIKWNETMSKPDIIIVRDGSVPIIEYEGFLKALEDLVKAHGGEGLELLWSKKKTIEIKKKT